MNRLPVRLRAAAYQNLRDLYDWIVSESGHPQIAEALADRILGCCERLGEFPMKGRARDDLQQGVRILPFERTAVIAYRIHDGEIEVINIFYAGRDYETSLLDDDDVRPTPKE